VFEKFKASAEKIEFRSTENFLNAKSNCEMKTCPYCGKEYPDDAVVCDLDESTLVLSKIDSSNSSKNDQRTGQPITISRILSVGGFAVLAGLSGFGATWLVVGILAKVIFKTIDSQLDFAAKSMPILMIGGIVGFIIGLVISLKVATADPKTEEEVEKKYIGQTGRLKIYFGAPIFIMAAAGMLTSLFESLERLIGPSVAPYVMLGMALLILAAAWALYDHIPEKVIIPIGIIGWMLTLSLIFWFCFYGPGAWGHH
jgi:hypothetical protein